MAWRSLVEVSRPWLLENACVINCEPNREPAVKLEDYKTVLYRQPDGAWVAEVPAIPGCYALMPTREEALSELASIFQRAFPCLPTPPKSYMPSGTFTVALA